MILIETYIVPMVWAKDRGSMARIPSFLLVYAPFQGSTPNSHNTVSFNIQVACTYTWRCFIFDFWLCALWWWCFCTIHSSMILCVCVCRVPIYSGEKTYCSMCCAQFISELHNEHEARIYGIVYIPKSRRRPFVRGTTLIYRKHKMHRDFTWIQHIDAINVVRTQPIDSQTV